MVRNVTQGEMIKRSIEKKALKSRPSPGSERSHTTGIWIHRRRQAEFAEKLQKIIKPSNDSRKPLIHVLVVGVDGTPNGNSLPR